MTPNLNHELDVLIIRLRWERWALRQQPLCGSMRELRRHQARIARLRLVLISVWPFWFEMVDAKHEECLDLYKVDGK